MEKPKRASPWVWVGSILIALVILGSVGLGAYRLYAFGWSRGVAAADGGSAEEAPLAGKMPPMPMNHYSGRRMHRAPLLMLFLGLLVFGAFARHAIWWRRSARRFPPHGPAAWAWHHHHPGYPDCCPDQENEDAGGKE